MKCAQSEYILLIMNKLTLIFIIYRNLLKMIDAQSADNVWKIFFKYSFLINYTFCLVYYRKKFLLNIDYIFCLNLLLTRNTKL